MPVKPRKRTTARVTVSEDRAKAPTKQIKDDRLAQKPEGVVKLIDGELHITAQIAETVPVAQYANVILGPVQLGWKLGGVMMEDLLDVDWDAIEDSDDIPKVMNAKQLTAWTRARGGLRATMMLLEFTLAEDRETIEDSIRASNAREAAEKKSK